MCHLLTCATRIVSSPSLVFFSKPLPHILITSTPTCLPPVRKPHKIHALRFQRPRFTFHGAVSSRLERLRNLLYDVDGLSSRCSSRAELDETGISCSCTCGGGTDGGCGALIVHGGGYVGCVGVFCAPGGGYDGCRGRIGGCGTLAAFLTGAAGGVGTTQTGAGGGGTSADACTAFGGVGTMTSFGLADHSPQLSSESSPLSAPGAAIGFTTSASVGQFSASASAVCGCTSAASEASALRLAPSPVVSSASASAFGSTFVSDRTKNPPNVVGMNRSPTTGAIITCPFSSPRHSPDFQGAIACRNAVSFDEWY